jgi:hypothetical protein
VIPVSPRLISFDFDVQHYGLATISEDSTLTMWNVHDKIPFWSLKVRGGEELPSSLTFVDGGIVIGRKAGTVFQLLSVGTKTVLSTVRFVNGAIGGDDPEMFGHVNYDSRIQTLWVANCRRESMIAFRIGLEAPPVGSSEEPRACFEQVTEFFGPKPTIHFVILTADADPTGEEAHAACVAAKVPPGELALVAFSVHSSGVDQVLIRREWYDSALLGAGAKFPAWELHGGVGAGAGGKHLIGGLGAGLSVSGLGVPVRLRTPPSEDVEGDITRDEGRVEGGGKGKAGKGKNVNWKDNDRDNGKEKGVRAGDVNIGESALGQALSKEIRKSEESLHTRIGRLIGKEMDKQRMYFILLGRFLLIVIVMVSGRSTAGRCTRTRTGGGLCAPREDLEADFYRVDEKYDACRGGGGEERSPELSPAFVGNYHEERGKGGAERPDR